MSIATARSAESLDRFVEAEATFTGLVHRLQSGDTARMSHSDLERLLEQEGRELMRQLLQAHLDRRAETKVAGPVVGADGTARTHARAGSRELETVFGTVTVSRDGHGAREHETLFPLDAALNLPAERYSFGIRQRAAAEATTGAFDDVVQVLATYSGADIAKRQVEEVVRRAAQDFDSFYIARRLDWAAETTPASRVLVRTFDGKGVPMRHADLRPATQAAAETRQRTLASRLTKGEKRHTRRMAQVAAVYTIAPFVRDAADIIRELGPPGAAQPTRPRPEGKRVWASLLKEPVEVIDEAFLDASSRDRQRQKQWVVLVDANADQLHRVLGGRQTVRGAGHDHPRPDPRARVSVEGRVCLPSRGVPGGREVGDRAPALVAVWGRRPGDRLDSAHGHVSRAEPRRAPPGRCQCRLSGAASRLPPL